MKRRIWRALGGLLLPAVMAASVTEKSPSPPEYRTVVSELSAATLVVITYYEGTVAMVTDPAWIEQLNGILAQAEGKPRSHCLCFNYPRVELLAKDRKLAAFELVHGNGLRFSGGSDSHDYATDEKSVRAIAAMLKDQQRTAIPVPKPAKIPPPPPPKLQIKPTD